MTRLNTSAGILEVMGPPLSGTDLRAYVMSGGGLTIKNFKPSIRGKRCFLIFPIRGSERKGLVSVEVKKKKGQVSFEVAYCILKVFALSLAYINVSSLRYCPYIVFKLQSLLFGHCIWAHIISPEQHIPEVFFLLNCCCLVCERVIIHIMVGINRLEITKI